MAKPTRAARPTTGIDQSKGGQTLRHGVFADPSKPARGAKATRNSFDGVRRLSNGAGSDFKAFNRLRGKCSVCGCAIENIHWCFCRPCWAPLPGSLKRAFRHAQNTNGDVRAALGSIRRYWSLRKRFRELAEELAEEAAL